MDQMTKPTV